MTDTNEAIQHGWLVETKSIQWRSLIEFAQTLHYEYDYVNNFFFAEYTKDILFKGCEIISLNKMSWLHNTSWVHSSRKENHLFPWPRGVHTCSVGNPLKLDSSSPFHVDVYTLNKAQSSKIVDQVYLNGGKSGISCYRQQIKFTDPQYEQLFLFQLMAKDWYTK